MKDPDMVEYWKKKLTEDHMELNRRSNNLKWLCIVQGLIFLMVLYDLIFGA